MDEFDKFKIEIESKNKAQNEFLDFMLETLEKSGMKEMKIVRKEKEVKDCLQEKITLNEKIMKKLSNDDELLKRTCDFLDLIKYQLEDFAKEVLEENKKMEGEI